MSSIVQPKQTIAVFGATGGCTLNFTIRALQNGHSVSALARTPSKLTNLLKQNQVSDELLQNITIIQGNTKDETKIAEALQINGQVVDMIVNGVGSLPEFKGLLPSQEDPTICRVTAANMLKALTSIRESAPSRYQKPTLVAISTTGISEYGRDIPLAMVPLYHWALKVPHEDKRAMEQMLKTEGAREGSLLRAWIVVRCSAFIGESEVGWENLKVGVEDGKLMDRSAIGYRVSKVDVGRWIYASLVEDKGGKRDGYLNKCVAITA